MSEISVLFLISLDDIFLQQTLNKIKINIISGTLILYLILKSGINGNFSLQSGLIKI